MNWKPEQYERPLDVGTCIRLKNEFVKEYLDTALIDVGDQGIHIRSVGYISIAPIAKWQHRKHSVSARKYFIVHEGEVWYFLLEIEDVPAFMEWAERQEVIHDSAN